jgi:Cytochrome c554 and c-prime
LFWKGDELFELPVSFWIELGEWANSPGYPDGIANFNRPIIPRCLECHATSFESRPPPENRFSKAGFVLGISCEKCHGPGREHVVRYNSRSGAPFQDGLVNPAKLPRDRQIDLCAWCHAGQGRALAPTFSYLPGERLDNYLELSRPDPTVRVDVHGSQVELLERSRCFKSSNMTCSTCHDVHAPQHDLAMFSQRCLGCHKIDNCGAYPKLGHSIASNCYDCHMPNQESNLILLELNGKKVAPKVRNHWIKVYAEFGVPASKH